MATSEGDICATLEGGTTLASSDSWPDGGAINDPSTRIKDVNTAAQPRRTSVMSAALTPAKMGRNDSRSGISADEGARTIIVAR